MHSAFELARKLKLKGFAAEEIGLAIEKLKQERYLNDEDTAESYLNSLINNKTFGYYGIKAKLHQKGFEHALVERLLEENFPLEKEEALAKKYLSKSRKTGQKAMAGLKSRGFRSQVISRVTSFDDGN